MRATPKRKAALSLLLFFAAGSAGWFSLRPSPAPPPVVLRPTAHQVAETQKHLDTLGKAVAGPGSNSRTLRLSEKDINVALAASLSLKKLLTGHGVKAVQIVLEEPDSIVAHASVAVQGHVQNIQISGAVAPDPKLGVRFTAASAKVGSLPLPPALVTSGANGLAARFSHQLLRHFSISVQGVYVQRKDLVIAGVPSRTVTNAVINAASPPTASPARH